MTWLKALPYLLAVALLAAWTGLVYQVSGKVHDSAVRLEWQAERVANARAAVDAFQRSLEGQWQMAEGLAARDAQHTKETDRVQSEKALLEHQLSTGAVRVSVPARIATCPAAGAAGASAAGQPAQARAELDPAFAAALAGITSDGDAGIVDLNACIDSYNEVRARINALTAPEGAHAQTP